MRKFRKNSIEPNLVLAAGIVAGGGYVVYKLLGSKEGPFKKAQDLAGDIGEWLGAFRANYITQSARIDNPASNSTLLSIKDRVDRMGFITDLDAKVLVQTYKQDEFNKIAVIGRVVSIFLMPISALAGVPKFTTNLTSVNFLKARELLSKIENETLKVASFASMTPLQRAEYAGNQKLIDELKAGKGAPDTSTGWLRELENSPRTGDRVVASMWNGIAPKDKSQLQTIITLHETQPKFSNLSELGYNKAKELRATL